MVRWLLALVITTVVILPPAVQAAPRCFPDVPGISACLDGRLREFWEQQGDLAVFGYPISPAAPHNQDADPVMVQWFERYVLEYHQNATPPYDVLLGRLGVDALQRQGRDWQQAPKADPSAPYYFAETGHAIDPRFWEYWSSHGLQLDGDPAMSLTESLALFGFPITEAARETTADGAEVLVQWFERARFEFHPTNPPGSQVLLGRLGAELAQPARPAGPGLPPGFVKPQGNQLTIQGQAIVLKGINYYPQGRPWTSMWDDWDGKQVQAELRLARDQLGINLVRVLFPYGVAGHRRDYGVVSADELRKLREMVQIAGQLRLKVIVTLFDFYEQFPEAGSEEEARDIQYLKILLGNFIGDDRIIAWDLHNEPDHYDPWKEGRAQQTLGWLGRMADAVHQIAPNHMVTVGMGQYDNLWQSGPDGRRVVDYSDLISIHNYNSADLIRQIDEVRRHTNRPILLGEFGWPSGPDCSVAGYNETRQDQVYAEALAASVGRTVGVVAWTLRDYDAGPSSRWDTREEHYGLYRADGSLKPAAYRMRAFAAPELPSIVQTDYPLTSRRLPTPDGNDAPIFFPETGRYLKGAFRRAYEAFGGAGSFGKPVSDAFIRSDDGRAVQYFEAALLEYYPEAARQKGYAELSERDKLAQLIRPVSLGGAYTAGRRFPAPTNSGGEVFRETGYAVQGSFLDFYRAVNGRWRLGVPLSDQIRESINGQMVQTQYFARGQLLWDDTNQRVVVRDLGRWAWEQRCRIAQ